MDSGDLSDVRRGNKSKNRHLLAASSVMANYLSMMRLLAPAFNGICVKSAYFLTQALFVCSNLPSAMVEIGIGIFAEWNG